MEGEYAVPLVLQLLLVELIIDVLKLASLNTPDVLGNSFSMLGALILGDFAVQSRWLVPEVLVYMAFVAVSNFAQHSFEMGYACKLCRMALVLLAFALRWWGFGIGLFGCSGAYGHHQAHCRPGLPLSSYPLERKGPALPASAPPGP